MFITSIIALIINVFIGINGGHSLLPIFDIICFTIATILGTGFTEEVLFRGIIQNILYDTYGKNTRKSILFSIIISSIIFGCAHFINLSSSSIIGVSIQVLSAISSGLYYGAIYARCNNIWSIIFLHGFSDFSQLIIIDGFWKMTSVSESISGYNTSMLPNIILMILISMFILRKKKIHECLEK